MLRSLIQPRPGHRKDEGAAIKNPVGQSRSCQTSCRELPVSAQEPVYVPKRTEANLNI